MDHAPVFGYRSKTTTSCPVAFVTAYLYVEKEGDRSELGWFWKSMMRCSYQQGSDTQEPST